MKNIFYVLFTLSATLIFSNSFGQEFAIRSKKGGKYLSEHREVKFINGRRTIQKTIGIYSDGGSVPITQFSIIPVTNENGYYYIRRTRRVNGQNYYTYLSNGAQRNTKAKVHLYSRTGNQEAFKWKFERAGGGYYNIKHKMGNYLDVQWGNTQDGTPVWMWQKNGDDAQLWQISRVNEGRILRTPYMLPRNNARNQVNNRTTNTVKTNPNVTVKIEDIKATHGDDGGSDKTFEFYTKIRIEKGERWDASSIPAYHYPKWSSSFLRAQPSGAQGPFKSYSYSKKLYGANSQTGTFKVYISLYDYDEASGDDWFDISPQRGANDLSLVIDQRTSKIYFIERGRRILVGRKGSLITMEGTDYNRRDEITARIKFRISW